MTKTALQVTPFTMRCARAPGTTYGAKDTVNKKDNRFKTVAVHFIRYCLVVLFIVHRTFPLSRMIVYTRPITHLKAGINKGGESKLDQGLFSDPTDQVHAIDRSWTGPKRKMNRIIIFKCIVVCLFCRLVDSIVNWYYDCCVVSDYDCEKSWKYTKFSELLIFSLLWTRSEMDLRVFLHW